MVPTGHAIEEFVESGAMVFDPCVTQFVDDDVIDQPIGQFHQLDTQRYPVIHGTASPAGPRVADRNRATRKMQCPTECFDSFGQIVLGLDAPRGLNAVSNGLLYIGVVIPCRRRVADPNHTIRNPDRTSGRGTRVEPQYMGPRCIGHSDNLFGITFRHPFLCPERPIGLLLQKPEGSTASYSSRYGQPHLPSSTHRETQSSCPYGPDDRNLSQYRMVVLRPF